MYCFVNIYEEKQIDFVSNSDHTNRPEFLKISETGRIWGFQKYLEFVKGFSGKHFSLVPTSLRADGGLYTIIVEIVKYTQQCKMYTIFQWLSYDKIPQSYHMTKRQWVQWRYVN